MPREARGEQMNRSAADVDIVDVFEEMLCQRAMKGLRPVLYVSSLTDLECNMVMLLDEAAEEFNLEQVKSSPCGMVYHVTTN
jgi:hypothetical protein